MAPLRTDRSRSRRRSETRASTQQQQSILLLGWVSARRVAGIYVEVLMQAYADELLLISSACSDLPTPD